MKVFLPLAVLALVLSGCGEEQSATLKQAIAVHDEVVRLSNQVHESLVGEMERVSHGIHDAFAAGDTALAQQLQLLEAELSELDLRFHAFSETVVEVPGYEHDHDHAGHDHAGHDHAGHDHSHSHGGPSLEGMSDEDILEIQQALRESVMSIQSELSAIGTTE